MFSFQKTSRISDDVEDDRDATELTMQEKRALSKDIKNQLKKLCVPDNFLAYYQNKVEKCHMTILDVEKALKARDMRDMLEEGDDEEGFDDSDAEHYRADDDEDM